MSKIGKLVTGGFTTAPIAALVLVAASAAFIATPKSAEARACGGLNQKACSVLRKHPGCRAWLSNQRGRCRPCGSLRQRACPLLKRGSPCKSGLRVKRGRCQQHVAKPNNSKILAKARIQIRKWRPVIRSMGGFARGMTRVRQVRALLKARRPIDVQRAIEMDPNIQNTYRALKRLGFNTMTIGIESSVSVGAGYARETGTSLDVHQRARGRLYVANSFYGGIVGNVGNDIVISAFTARNGNIGGPALGAMGSFDIGSGVGITIWYDKRTLRAIGISVAIGAGSVGGGGAVVSTKTRVF